MDSARAQQGHEVFHKAPLSLSGSAKQKRKAFIGNPKSSNSLKGKVKSQRGILGPLRSIENSGRGGKLAKKQLVCEPATLNSDLRRVLGHSPPPTSLASHPHQEACIEPPLSEVSTRVSQGLATHSIFPNSTYLSSTKAEIRKIMKQSNPNTYQQLKMCFTGPTETNHSLYSSLLTGHTIEPEPHHDSSPQFMLDSLQLDAAPPIVSPPNDLLDLVDSSEPEWQSPIKRPRLFPRKLY